MCFRMLAVFSQSALSANEFASPQSFDLVCQQFHGLARSQTLNSFSGTVHSRPFKRIIERFQIVGAHAQTFQIPHRPCRCNL